MYFTKKEKLIPMVECLITMLSEERSLNKKTIKEFKKIHDALLMEDDWNNFSVDVSRKIDVFYLEMESFFEKKFPNSSLVQICENVLQETTGETTCNENFFSTPIGIKTSPVLALIGSNGFGSPGNQFASPEANPVSVMANIQGRIEQGKQKKGKGKKEPQDLEKYQKQIKIIVLNKDKILDPNDSEDYGLNRPAAGRDIVKSVDNSFSSIRTTDGLLSYPGGYEEN